MDAMIYDQNTHKYLIRKYNDNLIKSKIHFGQLMNELNFSVESSYLSPLPYPHYVQMKFPEISDEWILKQFSYEKLIELLDKNPNPKIIYDYSFFFIDQNIVSLFLNWLMTAVDVRMKNMVGPIFNQLTDTLSVLNKNCPNKNSLNKYLDLWCAILKDIVETDNSFPVNGRRFGDYLNRNEYYAILALISGNKN